MCSLVTICGTMLMIQLEIVQYFSISNLTFGFDVFLLNGRNDGSLSCPFQASPVIDPLILSLAIFSAFFAFGALLLVCDLIERLSSAFIEVGDMVDQYKWYKFTGDMQRMLLMILIHVNESVTVKCFGDIACSRSTFKSVSFTNIEFSQTK